jgi:hypothetical protein
MGIRVQRFPEFGVTVNIYSGVVTADDIKAHLEALEAADVVRTMDYIAPSMDSHVEVTAIPELQLVASAKLRALHGDEPAMVAFLSESKAHAQVLSFWPTYLRSHGYPASAAAFTSLRAACEWLGLPDAACLALAEAVGWGGGL